MRILSRAFALGLVVALGACGKPIGVLDPVAVANPQAKRVDMFVVTTRSDAGVSSGEMFGGARATNAAFAEIAVSVPPLANRRIGDVQWPASLPADPAREFATVSAEKLDRDTALRRFHARMTKTGQRRVLLFVHGFNTRFEEAVYRFAQIAHDSQAPAVPVLFTWPSRGQLLAYTYDRESANYSRDALESLLQALSRDSAVGEITILAHSMGNWVALEALRQMAIRNGSIPTKIRSVMMASPDVDVDVFRRQLVEIGVKHPPFILFVSRDDKALGLSSRIWGDTPRLGAINPGEARYNGLLDTAGLQVIDLTDATSADSLNHGKFAENPEIVRLIGGRLAEGQTLTDANAGLGEKIGALTTGAASAVGRAAAITLSAPIAIVDPETRRNLPSQFEQLGDDAAGAVKGARSVLPTR
ncbi:MAG: esterase [Hyphomicrobiales bacterium]|nr:esterase [Hyphomicrobiales bacterium]